jgi:hypothetical protein
MKIGIGLLACHAHGGSDGTIAIADPHSDLIVCYFTQSRRGKTSSLFGPMIWTVLQ